MAFPSINYALPVKKKVRAGRISVKITRHRNEIHDSKIKLVERKYNVTVLLSNILTGRWND